jgi:hypothetical protein
MRVVEEISTDGTRGLRLLYHGCQDFLAASLFVYSYIYSSFKFGDPFFGRNDFFSYEKMVEHPLDLSAAVAPFVLRQVPTLIAWLFYHGGAHYDTKTVVDLAGLDDETRRRFLALILSNGLAFVLTFTVLVGFLRAQARLDPRTGIFTVFGLFAAWFYFPSAAIAPLTIAWGWLASTILALAIVRRGPAITLLGCALALFSRETTMIFAVTLALATATYDRVNRRALLQVTGIILATCMLYLYLRAFVVHGHENQVDVLKFYHHLKAFHLTRDFIFQSIVSQGLLVFIVILIGRQRLDYCIHLLIAASAVTIVGLGTGESELAFLTGETLPFYVLFLLLSQSNATRHDAHAVVPAPGGRANSALETKNISPSGTM